jgi:hypothetical protein
VIQTHLYCHHSFGDDALIFPFLPTGAGYCARCQCEGTAYPATLSISWQLLLKPPAVCQTTQCRSHRTKSKFTNTRLHCPPLSLRAQRLDGARLAPYPIQTASSAAPPLPYPVHFVCFRVVMAFSIAVQPTLKLLCPKSEPPPLPITPAHGMLGSSGCKFRDLTQGGRVNGEPLSRFHHFVSTLLKELERSAVCGLSVLPHMTSPMGTLHRLLKP